MPYELTSTAAPYVVAFVATAALWAALWRHRSRRAAKGFLVDVTGVVLLSATVALKVSATDQATKVFWWNWRFLAVPLMGVGYMVMALEYTDRGGLLDRKVRGGLAGFVALSAVAPWANGTSGLLYRAGDLQGGLLVPAFGPLYWAYAAVLVGCIVVGVTALVDLFRNREGYAAQIAVLVGTISLVMGGVVVWWTRLVPLDTLALTSTVKVLGFYLAVDRLQLLETMPVARATVVTNMDDPVFVLGTDGRIVDANPAASALVGERPAVHESIDDVLGVGLAEELRAADLSVDGKLARRELSLEVDGRARHYDLDLSAFPDGTGAVAVLRDVTERRKREQELTVLNRIVRHDIRNEMNVLHGRSQLLEPHLDAEAADDYRLVVESAQHVIEITDTVRELMETITSDGAMQTEPVALVPVVTAEVAKLRSNFPEATVEVGDLPDVAVTANEMLSSVFVNLLNNGVVHNRGDEPTVRVDGTRSGDTVQIRVADDGPGVDPGEREEIFGRGEKGLESEGTGVGLYLVDTLVTEFGGGVRAEDSDLGGATFVVELPVASTDAGGAGTDDAETTAGTAVDEAGPASDR